jgi:Ribosomal L30 N-terminal domain
MTAAAKVPESLLKKRQRDEKWALAKTEAAAVAKKQNKDKRKVILKKAEAYVKEYRAQVGFPAIPVSAAILSISPCNRIMLCKLIVLR